jgi:hypothetical protein
MDGAIYAASAQQRRIRGVHNGVSCLFGDVGRPMDLQGLSASQPKAQCEIVHAGLPEGEVLFIAQRFHAR